MNQREFDHALERLANAIEGRLVYTQRGGTLDVVADTKRRAVVLRAGLRGEQYVLFELGELEAVVLAKRVAKAADDLGRARPRVTRKARRK